VPVLDVTEDDRVRVPCSPTPSGLPVSERLAMLESIPPEDRGPRWQEGHDQLAAEGGVCHCPIAPPAADPFCGVCHGVFGCPFCA